MNKTLSKRFLTGTASALIAAAVAIPSVCAQAPAIAAPTAKPAAPAAKPAAPAAKPTFESALAFLPDVLAEVGSEKLTKKDFIAQMGRSGVAPEMLAQFPPDLLKNILANQINEMVEQMLLAQLAAMNGFKPSPELVKSTMNEQFKKLDANQKEQITSALKSQGKTFESIQEENAKNPDIQKQAAIAAYVQSRFIGKPENKVSDADAEKFYRENQAMFAKPTITVSHILAKSMTMDDNGKALSPEEAAKQDAAAKAKIDGIMAKLKQGAKFEDLAKESSDCPSGKQTSGKLPAFDEKGQMEAGGAMEPTFVEASLALTKPNEISEIVKTPFGYHIIRLEEKKAPTFIPFAEVKDEIVNQLSGRKISAAIQAALDQAKKDMKVKIHVQAQPMPAPAK